MIPRAYILEWQKSAPWKTNAQIEQDMVIERALIELFSDDIIRENLAFRGGTALHKIFMKPQVRYSEDIDLVQIHPTSIKPILLQIKKAMSFLGSKRSVKQNEVNNTIVYRFDTEIAPVINSRLKLEINCREHFSELGFKKVFHRMDSSWFSGSTEIISYELEELLGTELRALYQRKKGRDLFDIYYAMIQLNPDCNKIIACFKRYMIFSNGKAKTSKEFLINMDEKMKSNEFNSDIVSIIRPDVAYDFNKAYELVKQNIIEKI